MRNYDLDELARRCGGRFKMSVLLQKRARELIRGVPPLIEDMDSADPIDIALEELERGLIELDYPERETLQPGEAPA
jgi:DNA-directed RNA polymerase omega subunit